MSGILSQDCAVRLSINPFGFVHVSQSVVCQFVDWSLSFLLVLSVWRSIRSRAAHFPWRLEWTGPSTLGTSQSVHHSSHSSIRQSVPPAVLLSDCPSACLPVRQLACLSVDHWASQFAICPTALQIVRSSDLTLRLSFRLSITLSPLVLSETQSSSYSSFPPSPSLPYVAHPPVRSLAIR